MSISDGGPAFPIEGWKDIPVPPDRTGIPFGIGMSMRDHFATHCPVDCMQYLQFHGQGTKPQLSLLDFCLFRYEYADAMLQAREVPQ